jgi:hypothetical protein
MSEGAGASSSKRSRRSGKSKRKSSFTVTVSRDLYRLLARDATGVDPFQPIPAKPSMMERLVALGSGAVVAEAPAAAAATPAPPPPPPQPAYPERVPEPTVDAVPAPAPRTEIEVRAVSEPAPPNIFARLAAATRMAAAVPQAPRASEEVDQMLRCKREREELIDCLTSVGDDIAKCNSFVSAFELCCRGGAPPAPQSE